MDNGKNLTGLSMKMGLLMDKPKGKHYDSGKRNRKVVR